MITRFEEVKLWGAAKSGKCPVCGKRTRRVFQETQTVNPWNRRPDGTPRSYAEIRADLKARFEAWKPDFRHSTCAPDRGADDPNGASE